MANTLASIISVRLGITIAPSGGMDEKMPVYAEMAALRKSRTISGFTLIEMSIVLMIIGFLIAGIMLGTTIKRHAKLVSMMSDEQKYVQAVSQFQQKYNYLPGDFPNATSYWGANTNCSSGGTGTGTGTCNGNGDGQVETLGEDVWFWQHLANAQMIPGHYTGTWANANNWWSYIQIGQNAPATKVDGAGFSWGFLGLYTSNNQGGSWYAANYGHVLVFGAQDINYYMFTWVPIISPNEARGIDNKYDDGLPVSGSILSETAAGGNCANDSLGQYLTTGGDTLNSCTLVFITGF